MKLVVIEDQAMFRRFMLEACRQALPEAEMKIAESGGQALVLCQEYRPDVVILDLVLPDCSGLDLVPQLREFLPRVRIVAVSAWVDEYTIHRVMELGVEGFVDKGEQTFATVVEAIHSVRNGGTYYSAAVQRVHARLRSDSHSFAKLISNREMQLLPLFGRGLSNEEIARLQNLSANTVRNHRQNIMSKLGLTSTPQLIHYALEKGFISHYKTSLLRTGT